MEYPLYNTIPGQPHRFGDDPPAVRRRARYQSPTHQVRLIIVAPWPDRIGQIGVSNCRLYGQFDWPNKQNYRACRLG